MKMTLWKYFLGNLERSVPIIDHAVRAEVRCEGHDGPTSIQFYIHPANCDGETPMFALYPPMGESECITPLADGMPGDLSLLYRNRCEVLEAKVRSLEYDKAQLQKTIDIALSRGLTLAKENS